MLKLTVPNILSLSRIFMLPLLFWLALANRPSLFLATYIIVGSTDYFDGLIARKFSITSPIGKVLDSVADLFFYISSAWFLYHFFPQVIVANNTWLIVFFSMLGLSFVVSSILLKKPVLMHTSILRFNAVLVYAVIILSFTRLDTTLFTRIVLISYMLGFTEEMLIWSFFGDVDPDTKSIFHLMKERKDDSLQQ